MDGHAASVGRLVRCDVAPGGKDGRAARSADVELVSEFGCRGEASVDSATSLTTLSRPVSFASYIAASARANIDPNDRSCHLRDATPQLTVSFIG